MSGRLPAAAAAAAFLFLLAGCARTVTVRYQYPGDIPMWEHIFGVTEAWDMPSPLPEAVVIPHHDITTDEQNSFYKALSQRGQPPVVAVLSPDHYETGRTRIVAPRGISYDTPDGSLPLAEDMLSALRRCGYLADDVSFMQEPWAAEHGIYAHTPFIRRYFPGTRLLPLLLRTRCGEDEFGTFKDLARFLAEALPPGSLVVASVDFSHFQIPRVTELHDCVSLHTIANGEDPAHIEVDSSESLAAVMEYARLRGATVPVLLHRTSTYDYVRDELVMSTSHQYWTFYPPSAGSEVDAFFARREADPGAQRAARVDYAATRNLVVLFGGSGDVGAGIRMWWEWDRTESSQDRGDVLLRALGGTRGRFLRGFDALIFDPAGDFHGERHGTALSVECMALSAASGLLIPQGEYAAPRKDVRVLVLSYAEGDPLPGSDAVVALCGRLLSAYDVVVVRDPLGREDAWAYLHAEEGDRIPPAVNLGILHSPEGGHREGCLLALNWYAGRCTAETFPYQSDDGTVPAIHQFDAD